MAFDPRDRWLGLLIAVALVGFLWKGCIAPSDAYGQGAPAWPSSVAAQVDFGSRDSQRLAATYALGSYVMPLSAAEQEWADGVCTARGGPSALAVGEREGSYICGLVPEAALEALRHDGFQRYVCAFFKQEPSHVVGLVLSCRVAGAKSA